MLGCWGVEVLGFRVFGFSPALGIPWRGCTFRRLWSSMPRGGGGGGGDNTKTLLQGHRLEGSGTVYLHPGVWCSGSKGVRVCLRFIGFRVRVF